MALGVELRVQGAEIAPDRVTKLILTQTLESELDALQATVTAEGAPIPPSGRTVEAWINGAYMGGYAVADLSLVLPDDAIEILGTGADMHATGLRTPATRAWADGLTIGGLAEQIAKDHGYEARVHASLRGIVLAHVDQIAESDLQFLSRQADQLDADLRFSAGFLMLLPRAGEETARALDLRQRVDTWNSLRVRFRDRTDWRAVEARYFDYDQGRPIVIRVGDPDAEAYQVLGVHGDADLARRAAETARSRLSDRTSRLTLSTAGNPLLIPHTVVTLPAIREGVPDAWRVTEVIHAVDDDEGYVTHLRGVPAGEDGPPRPAPPKQSKLTYSRVRYQDPNLAYRRLVDSGPTLPELPALPEGE